MPSVANAKRRRRTAFAIRHRAAKLPEQGNVALFSWVCRFAAEPPIRSGRCLVTTEAGVSPPLIMNDMAPAWFRNGLPVLVLLLTASCSSSSTNTTRDAPDAATGGSAGASAGGTGGGAGSSGGGTAGASSGGTAGASSGGAAGSSTGGAAGAADAGGPCGEGVQCGSFCCGAGEACEDVGGGIFRCLCGNQKNAAGAVCGSGEVCLGGACACGNASNGGGHACGPGETCQGKTFCTCGTAQNQNGAACEQLYHTCDPSQQACACKVPCGSPAFCCGNGETCGAADNLCHCGSTEGAPGSPACTATGYCGSNGMCDTG